MSKSIQDVLRYWRASLADSALGEGKFSRTDQKRFIEVPSKALQSGILSGRCLNDLFAGQSSAQVISVRLWPQVMARRLSHGASISDGLPEIVAPVVTDALVNRDGHIIPLRNTLARDLLSPLPSGELSLGTVDDLDLFLTKTPLPPVAGEGGWKQYLDHCRNLIDQVAEGWPHDDTDYLQLEIGLIEPAMNSNAAIRAILALYDNLLNTEKPLPLLEQIIEQRPSGTDPDPHVPLELARRLAHSNPQFPLSAHQRDVLAWLDAAQPGEVIAVNGPPGTGKTTMLLSAVAGLWVKAAIRGENPPIIVAASSNNQAVTNIIDAFGKDFAKGEGPFAGRWLPGIDSFGMFLPSSSRQQQASELYQTELFQQELERSAYVQTAKNAYLAAAKKALPNIANLDVANVVASLQARIIHEANKLRSIDEARSQYEAAASAQKQRLGSDPAGEERKQLDIVEACQIALGNMQSAKQSLKTYLASESIFIALFEFLPAVRTKRALRTRMAIGELLPNEEGLNSVADIEEKLEQSRLAAIDSYSESKKRLDEIKSIRQAYSESQHLLLDAVAKVEGGEKITQLENHLDTTLRFNLFLLATHYWEGRWLLEMEADLARIEASHRKTGKATLVPRWYRRMMLTPCAVSTFATLPNKLSYRVLDGSNWSSEYLHNFIDLMIVDEAGQVLPEVAGGAFSFAKQALVIGDTQQIEPISSLSKPIDAGNLRAAGILAEGKAISSLSDRGLCSSNGSAMRLAQAGCHVSPYKELEKGLYLFEHRRCYDEIINYSNALCYKGKLRPMRGMAPEDARFPALGYLHIDGRAFSKGSSRVNPLEAQTIAAWLDANRSKLEAKYNRPLEAIVGVVTPFGRQVGEIRQACEQRKIAVNGREGMTVGTVHSLQGAERPVIIFSPVYSKHGDGGFIDLSPSMLNVMVSRAKDSCLIFGDMDVLGAAATGTPRALLASFLFAEESNRLEFAAEPRADLYNAVSDFQMLRDAAQHDDFLLSALKAGGRKYAIVSPWLIANTMEKVGILSAFEAAINRGAEINVYTDPLLNSSSGAGQDSQLSRAETAFEKIGVRLHLMPKLHSKIVAIDTEVLCIGSYNWLSADRYGEYARHETSILYQGEHLEDEISTILASLRGREAQTSLKDAG